MASKWELKTEERINNIVDYIGQLELRVEELEKYYEYKSTDGKGSQPARGHGAEGLKADHSAHKGLAWQAFKEPEYPDEDGRAEGVEPGKAQKGRAGRGDKKRVEDKELCEVDGC